MQTNLAVGDRVSLIPFKHKGKVGVIKYLGEVEGKPSGNWLGIELEEGTGVCSGEHEEKTYFECKPQHGIFLRPGQVKSLEEKTFSAINVEEVESGITGIENMREMIGGQKDSIANIDQVEKNLEQDPTSGSPAKKPEPEKKETAAAAGGGKLKGWKERLAKLRADKEAEKAKADEKSTIAEPESNEKQALKEIFAPAKGLEKDETGKLKVDKEKVEEKKEIDFEKREEVKIDQALKSRNPMSSVLSQASATTDGTSGSDKPKTTPSRLAAPTASSASKSGVKEPGSGLRAPSRISKPTATQEARQQALLEKQKAVKEKMAEKNAAARRTTGGVTSRINTGRTSVKPGDAPSAATVRATRLAENRAKAEEAKSRLTSARGSTANLNSTNRTTTGRVSARPGTQKDDLNATNRVRSSASKERQDLQFNRGRQGSSTRDAGVTGVQRSSSKEQGKDMAFGARRRSSSRGNLGLNFGKSGATGNTVELDPSMTTIKKTELEELKKELQEKKDEAYNLAVEMKKKDNEVEVMKRDHQDALEKQESDLTEKNRKQQEEMLLKFADERNDLIAESNKGNDEKYNQLKQQFDELEAAKKGDEEAHTVAIAKLKEEKDKDLADLTQSQEAKYNLLKNEMDQKVTTLETEKSENNDRIVKMAEKIQTNKMRIEELELTIQNNNIDLEANQLEIEELRHEKDKLIDEMTENSKLEQDDILNSLSTDELKGQNRKLRQAVTSMAKNFETEKAKLMKKIEDEEGKKKIIDAYEAKLADMDVLLEELDRKEYELAEMKEENAMCLEYENMVEEMTHEILRKEEEIKEWQRKFKASEDTISLQENYTESLEQLNQELTNEVADLEARISQMEAQKQEDEELMVDLDDENQKYREKVSQLNANIKELTEQLSAHTADSGEKSKVAILVDSQAALQQKLKEKEKKELDQQVAKIDYHWSGLVKQRVIENVIPPRLQESVHFDSLDRLNLLNKSVNRALMMIRLLCERSLPGVVNQTNTIGNDDEEFALKLKIVRMFIKLAAVCANFVNFGQKILLCLTNMSIEQYVKATTGFAAWKRVENVHEEIGNVINRLKDDNISAQFDCSILESHINQVSELSFKIEKLFIEKTPEELATENPDSNQSEDSVQKYQMSPAQLERQKFLQDCNKLELRNQALKMSYAVIGLKVMIGDLVGAAGPNFSKKAQLIYGRLLDIIFKVDHIDPEDTGKQYLNLNDLQTDKRLGEKFDVIAMLWAEEVPDAETIGGKDWGGIMEAAQRDITQLCNDYKYKRLIKTVEEAYEEQSKMQSLDQIFFVDKFRNDSSPWMQISKKIQTDIQNAEQLKDKIEQLNKKKREQYEVNMQQERNMNTMKVTQKSLEQRLAQAQTKIEELNNVKTENKQLGEKTNIQKKQLDASVKEIDHLKKALDDTVKKCELIEKKAAQGQIALEQQSNNAVPDNFAGFRKNKGGQQPSRQSRTSAFFQELARTSMLQGRKIDVSMTPMNVSRGSKGMNSVDIQKALMLQEEQYSQVLGHLQYDRMKLKGNTISEKLNRLQREGGAFNAYIKKTKEESYTQAKISQQDEGRLIEAIKKVNTLKASAKLQMASVRVVDLAAKREQMQQAQREPVQQETAAQKLLSGNTELDGSKSSIEKANMNINYAIVQTKEILNNAIQRLMAKQDRHYDLLIDKVAREEAGKGIAQKTECLATISLRSDKQSDEPTINKDVVVSTSALRALQNNVGLYSV